jgi:hypothetical protein
MTSREGEPVPVPLVLVERERFCFLETRGGVCPTMERKKEGPMYIYLVDAIVEFITLQCATVILDTRDIYMTSLIGTKQWEDGYEYG